MSTTPQPGLETLVEFMQREVATPAPGFEDLAARIRDECGAGVDAVLLYGSCLRINDAAAGVVDLLVIVDAYERAPGGRAQRALNALLPPNVYFIEQARGAASLRCKYAVVSMRDFEAGTRDWLQPYFWARFAQPSRLLHARDPAIREWVCRCLASAVATFLRNVLPTMAGETLPAREVWRRGFALSYGAELRPESGSRPAALTSGSDARLDALIAAAIPALTGLIAGAGPGIWTVTARPEQRRAGLRRWRLRRWQGTLLSVARWMKAAFTFSGGVDYAAWKIERHTGLRIEVTERLRRHPLIYGWPILWRLWRRGVLR